mgnify:CR=1 FL=1
MMLKNVLALAIVLGISACSSDSSEPEEELEQVDNGNDNQGSFDLVDITNVTFTKRDASCTDYEGNYNASVMDVQNNTSFVGEVSVSNDESSCTLEANTIPNHDFNDTGRFATDVSELSASFNIPAAPQFANQVTELSLGTAEAILLNGITLDILAAACYGIGNEPLGTEKIGCGGQYDAHPWRYDPMSELNNFGTDSHNAHSQPSGKYHYHGNPMAMFEQNCQNASSPSPVIGFAADGFPIYGTCVNDNGTVREVQSSYRLLTGIRQSVGNYLTPEAGQGDINSNNYDGQFRGDYEYVNNLGDLDECNGMTVDGQYGYYITNSYPWLVNCFKGAVDSSFQGGGIAVEREHGHVH